MRVFVADIVATVGPPNDKGLARLMVKLLWKDRITIHNTSRVYIVIFTS